MTYRFRRGLLALLAIVTLGAVAPSGALAASSDDINSPVALELGIPEAGSNVGYTRDVAGGEFLNCSGSSAEHTAWYTVVGDGRPITLNAGGSDFDTMIGLFDGVTGSFIACDDDSPSSVTSQLTFNSQNGKKYFVMLAGCTVNPQCGASEGNILMTADDRPGNDERSAATAVAVNRTIDGDNLGATTNGTELNECGSGHPYGRTVWYRFTAPAKGTATVNVSSAGLGDPVVRVYRGSAASGPCQDDAPGQTRSASLPVAVTAGTYYVQVGGFGDDAILFNLQVLFARSLDQDGDGYDVPADCNDSNTTIHPGATDTPNDGIDQDCKGGDAIDADHDGSLFGVDCDDHDPGRFPGNPDIPGDGKDQNCDGVDGQLPVVRASFTPTWVPFKKFTRMIELLVKAPRGSKIRLHCSGHGCPFRTKTFKARAHGRTAVQKKLKARLRDFPVGRKLEVRVSKRGFRSKARVYRMRSLKAPVYDDFCGDGRARRSC
jgi:Putative metal-binding motif